MSRFKYLILFSITMLANNLLFAGDRFDNPHHNDRHLLSLKQHSSISDSDPARHRLSILNVLHPDQMELGKDTVSQIIDGNKVQDIEIFGEYDVISRPLAIAATGNTLYVVLEYERMISKFINGKKDKGIMCDKTPKAIAAIGDTLYVAFMRNPMVSRFINGVEV